MYILFQYTHVFIRYIHVNICTYMIAWKCLSIHTYTLMEFELCVNLYVYTNLNLNQTLEGKLVKYS